MKASRAPADNVTTLSPPALYFDYAATTPVDPRVAARMAECLTVDGVFGNPASTHQVGRTARGRVELARRDVAALVNANAREIVWTSGATESNNLALQGAMRYGASRGGRHVITARTEHKAVLDTCKQLESEGFDVTYLLPASDGLVDPAAVQAALRDDTALVSIMHVNNEIGVVQDIRAIGDICRAANVTFHVDAAQSAGKIPIDLQTLPVCLMSFSAHKIYGPKGIGALYVCSSPRTNLSPIIHGGGHERGLRSGTLATHQIVGMGEAFAVAARELDQEGQRLGALRDRLWQGLEVLGGVRINGHPTRCVSGILNVSVDGVEGESLLFALRRLALSSGSACTSTTAEASYVLRALGLTDQQAQSSLRFSVGRFTSEQDVDQAIRLLQSEIPRLRALNNYGDAGRGDDNGNAK